MTKYHEYFQLMVSENQELFEHFKKLHDYYSLNPNRYQLAFNVEGEKIVAVIREYERKLCGHSEKGKYGKFSSGLADKFWEQVRKQFPKIDFVGVKRN